MVDRLSPTDASFLHMEEDGVSQMHIAAVAIFEGPPPAYADVLAMIRGKLPLVPRYRQVVRPVPLDLGRPVWVDDPDFDLEQHVRRTALPPPGGKAELRGLVGRVMTKHLDRDKPLWETWVVEGLDDGTWALMFKTHHAMIDGVAGTDLMSVMMDITPQSSEPVPDDWRPEPAPGPVELAVDALVELGRSPYEQLRALRAATRRPRQAAERLAEIARGTAAIATIARPTRPSSLNGPIGQRRRCGPASWPPPKRSSTTTASGRSW